VVTNDWLTIATGNDFIESDSSNSRPARSGMFIARKYSGVMKRELAFSLRPLGTSRPGTVTSQTPPRK
jgi:hypothetical protein